MTVKEMAIRTIQDLPEDATWEEIRERINFVAAVRQAEREIDEGKGIPHEKVKEWLGRLTTDDISADELARLASESGSFDWLGASEENIYSIEDGEPVQWPEPQSGVGA